MSLDIVSQVYPYDTEVADFCHLQLRSIQHNVIDTPSDTITILTPDCNTRAYQQGRPARVGAHQLICISWRKCYKIIGAGLDLTKR